MKVAKVSKSRVGPALKQLDALTARAGRITFCVQVEMETPNITELKRLRRLGWKAELGEVWADSKRLKNGSGLRVPDKWKEALQWNRFHKKTLSEALIFAASHTNPMPLKWETLTIKVTKCRLNLQELRPIVVRALAEAFGQKPPIQAKLAKSQALHRKTIREKRAGEKQKRAKTRAAAEKAIEVQRTKLEGKIKKAVGGQVTDLASFLTALNLRIERPKIDKATSMLKASGFQLYNDAMADNLSGIVKSQTDPDLVYACRIDQDGHYSCCTQNLNVCGGLRGALCKHLLVLIIGLVQAGQLDPLAIDGWIAKSMQKKAALDKDKMGEVFIKYKGAESGEVDWRPTETLPEDYYAV